MKSNFASLPSGLVKYRSIRVLLIYALVLAVLVPAIVTNLFAAVPTLNNAKDQAANQLGTVGSLRELQINSWLGNLQYELRDTANQELGSLVETAIPAGDATALREFLSRVATRATNREALFVVDMQGKVLVSTDDSLLTGQYSQWVISGRIRQPYIVPLSAGDAIPTSLMVLQPIVVNSRQIAALVGRYSLEPLIQIMQDRGGLGNTGETYLLTRQDKLLTNSRFDGFPAGTSIKPTDGSDHALSDQTNGHGIYTGYRSDAVIGSYRWLPVLEVALMAEQELSEIQAPIINSLVVNAMVTLIAALIAIVAGLYLIDRSINRPLESLAQTAQQIADGNLRLRSSLTPQNEIGVVAGAFNRMTDQLADSIQTLELRVKDRTRDVEAARLQAERASGAKSTFLSNMSHELRTPLNVIIGYTSSMLDMPEIYGDLELDPMHQRDINLVKDSGYYLLGLINDILDMSKIEAGKLELHCTAVNLPLEFAAILATSVGLVKDKPIQIRPDFPNDLPKVWADATRMRQIILNLMSNAIKFTQTGNVTLHAHVEGQQVHISVIDTGIGIPEKALAHIFDRFEQADSETEKHYGGTGLGLDISKQLARMHGSDLVVQSTVGQGSKFTFILPLATEQQAGEPVLIENTSRSVKTLPSMDIALAHTILLVEDEASMRDMMRRALESVDYVVVDLQDGAEVLEMAIGLLPDLIILDIRLPNINGWELLQSLKENVDTSAIPVMVCTGNEDDQRAKEMGANLYIRKPFSTDELLACVRELLPSALETDKGNA